MVERDAAKARFLAALRASGNVTLAARQAGIGEQTPYKWRRTDEAFAQAWREALAESAVCGSFDEASRGRAGADFGDGFVIRRGRGGRMQVVAAGEKYWRASDEDAFLGHLARSGNCRAAARAAGVSVSAAKERRERCPSFGEAYEKALDEAYAELEWRLVQGANEALRKAGSPSPAGAGEDKFDPHVALNVLKARDARRAGRGWGRRSGQPVREPSIQEVKESIMRKLDAMDRHEKKYGPS